MGSSDEVVLCIKPENYENYMPKHSDVFSKDVFWMTRGACEKDNKYKQIIPYIVFYDGCTDSFLGYERKAGDSRLTGMHSLGLGGHVNKDDYNADTIGQTLLTNMRRELNEEHPLIANEVADVNLFNYLRGFIYDDSNEVGSVHLGLVFIVPLNLKEEHFFDDAEHIFKRLDFNVVKMLSEENKLENWSNIVFNGIILKNPNTRGFYKIND